MQFLAAILFLLLLIPTLFIEKIYERLGQDEQVAAYGAEYVHIVMPFVFFYMQGQTYATYSMSHRVTSYARNANIVGFLAHVAMIGIFCFYLDW